MKVNPIINLDSKLSTYINNQEIEERVRVKGEDKTDK